MKIVYLGTPDFSVEPLKRILQLEGHEVVAVVCNNDKPFGRKKILTAPPVKVFAKENGIRVLQYDKIRKEGVEDLKSINPDIMITCAFGQILSQEILDIPKFGVINIHASLLPYYRGASPIHYALLNGEKKTGITIMKTDVGIDTGDIILQKELEILPNENCGSLFSRLSILGAECVVDALNLIEEGKATFTPQDNKLATFTKIIEKKDALIEWNDSADKIFNQVRAFNPSPIAFTLLNGEPFKIYECEISEREGNVGEVIFVDKNTLCVGCGNNSINLKIVQKSGGKTVNIKDFLLGKKFDVGFKFGV
ncbi:MAG: methionyl-tRNA formyltransferase [Clostridia bacterium]|nr:methionyl-tRNA formyltransferase [Clostridia bacterium]